MKTIVKDVSVLNKKDKHTFIEYINNEYTRRKLEKEFLTKQWYINKRFLEGKHNFSLDEHTGEIIEISEDDSTSSVKTDIISTVLETRQGFLSANIPKVIINEKEGDTSQTQLAVISNEIYNTHSLTEMKSYDTKLKQVLEAYGNSFMISNWGSEYLFKNDEELVKKNNVKNILVSPFEIFPMSLDDYDIQTTKNVMYVKAYSKEYVEYLFPELEDMLNFGKKNNVTQQTKEVLDNNEIDTKHRVDSTEGSTGTEEGDAKNTHVNFIHYFERPSKRYNKGRFALIVEDNLLEYKEELPVIIDNRYEIPILQMKQNDTTNSFFCRGILERALPLQIKYNLLAADLEDLRKTVTIGNLVLNPNSLVDDEQGDFITPGEVIQVDPSVAGYIEPHFIKNDTSALIVLQQEMLIVKDDLVQVTGVNPTAIKGTDTNQRTGIQMAMALEQNESRFAITLKSISDFYVEHAKLVLSLFKKHGTKTTLEELELTDNSIGQQEWKTTDIITRNVTIGNLPELLQTEAQKLQSKLQLLQLGAYNREETNPFDQEKLAGLFASAGDSNVKIPKSKRTVELEYIERVKNKIVKAEKPEELPKVRIGANVEFQIKELQKWSLTSEYEKLSEENEVLDEHLLMFINELKNILMKELELKKQLTTPT